MITLNLLPESVQAAQARRRHVKRWALILAVTAVAGTIPAGAHWMQHLQIEELGAQSEKLQSDLAAARVELRTATAEANDAFLRLERAKALRSKRAWSGMLALIGSCLPKQCWLNSIATDPEVPGAGPVARSPLPPAATPGAAASEKPAVVTIEAPRKLRISGEALDSADPLSFVAKLKESQVFRNVILERSLRERPEQESQFRFELICEW
jgi:outer membrane murein-binding lipoprotein Lpp